MNNMAQTDLVGMENIAEETWERPISELKEGVGSMPGKTLQEIDKDTLISGRGLIP